MSTRSRIAIERDNGTIDSIYCHSDGYYEYNGAILNKFYQDQSKVEGLIALGDLSCLGTTIDLKNDGSDEGCRDYHRWRDEELVINHHKNMKELMEFLDDCDQEYLYIFRSGKWYAMKIEWQWHEWQLDKNAHAKTANKEESLKPLDEIMKGKESYI